MDNTRILPVDYPVLLSDIKRRIHHAQTHAVFAVNAEMIRLYWDIGALIHQRQHQEGWGAAVIPRLARDLHNELPEEKGFSERNIKRMLTFYREYPYLDTMDQRAKVPRAVAQNTQEHEEANAELFPAQLLLSVPWGHHAELIAKVKSPAVRQWYMRFTLEYGWSRNILLMQIESSAHTRTGRAASNSNAERSLSVRLLDA